MTPEWQRTALVKPRRARHCQRALWVEVCNGVTYETCYFNRQGVFRNVHTLRRMYPEPFLWRYINETEMRKEPDIDRAIACLLEAQESPLVQSLIAEALSFLRPEELTPFLVEATVSGTSCVTTKIAWNDPVTNVPWSAVLLRPGDRFGRPDPSGHRPHEVTSNLVEFYDMRFDHDPEHRGQFVSSYYLPTLLNHQGGLRLDSHNDWTLSAESVELVKTHFKQGA